MNILGTLRGWARSAFGFIGRLGGDIGRAYSAIWHYVSNVHNALAWITGVAQLELYFRFVKYLITSAHAHRATSDAFRNLARWIWLTMIAPFLAAINRRHWQLFHWTVRQLRATWMATLHLVAVERAARVKADTAERAARVKGDMAEHAAMLKAVAACLATVQKQAASGYNSQAHARLSVVGQLLNDLADRNPAVRGLVSALVQAVLDLESVDNPVVRFGIAKLFQELVAHLGVDKVTGDLIGRLLGPFTGGGPPADLAGVERDVAARLNALEQQWADFMTRGGPEVEQAGDQWKALGSVLTDAALLGFFGLAVTEPAAWAAGVADTAGTLANDTLGKIASLLS